MELELDWELKRDPKQHPVRFLAGIWQQRTATQLTPKELGQLRDLNKQGIKSVECMKCNFDVEIGVQMLLDHHIEMLEGFCLWSGDSDFADPLAQLLRNGKKVSLFATARRIASELSELSNDGLAIYAIKKIKEFIAS